MVWAALGSNRGATGWLRAEHSRTAPTTAPETARFGVAITDSVTEGSNAKKTPATVHPKNPVIPAITKLCRMDTGTAGRVGRHRCLAGRDRAAVPAINGPKPLPPTKTRVADVEPSVGRSGGEASTIIATPAPVPIPRPTPSSTRPRNRTGTPPSTAKRTVPPKAHARP